MVKVIEKAIEYVKAKPLERIVYSICGTGAVANIGDMLIKREASLENIASILLLGISAGSIKLYSYIKGVDYEGICSVIKEYGFNQYVMQDKKYRKLALRVAKETGKIEEYEEALKKYKN